MLANYEDALEHPARSPLPLHLSCLYTARLLFVHHPIYLPLLRYL